jgi:hypothetical protein
MRIQGKALMPKWYKVQADSPIKNKQPCEIKGCAQIRLNIVSYILVEDRVAYISVDIVW